MNNVCLVGNLARDPELRYTGTGKAVTTLTVAVNRGFGSKEADFIPVVVWEKRAETCVNYLSKGRKVGITGRLQVRSYEAQNGEKRYVTEVVATNVEFLSYAADGNKQGTQQTNQQKPQQSQAPQKVQQSNPSNGYGDFDIPDGFSDLPTDFEDDEDLPF